MAMKYEPPAWAADGRNAFSLALEVIKSGVVMESVALPPQGDQSFAVVGRMEPVCDLVLQHPSISRQHAVLQFDATGALFLRDLRSTHGTFINKKRIDASDYVRVHVGDVLVFGESTRLYAVTGAEQLKPAEYESHNLASLRERSERKNQAKKKAQESGASWGFCEDAEEEEDDEPESDEEADKKEKLPDYLRNLKDDQRPYQSSIQANDMNEKDQKLFQSLQSRIKKMENLKLEAARITAKQHQLTGLSEGQQQTLARNEQRVQALMAEIEKIEEQIHAKNTQRQSTKSSAALTASSKAKPRRSAYEHDSDEDEFYDRTKANQRKLQERKQQLGGAVASSAATLKKSTGVVLTAESIQQNIQALEESLVEIDREYESAQADSVAKSAPAGDAQEEDALDSFMAATSEQLQASRLAAIHARKVEAESERARQQQLLSIAMPALPSKETSFSKPVPTPAPVPSSKPVPMPAPLPSFKDHKPLPPKSFEPEAITFPADTSKPVQSVSTEPELTAGQEEPKTTQQVKVHSRPIEIETTKPSQSSPRKKSRIVGPSAPPKQSKIGPTMPIATNLGPANELEGGDRVWVPPSNQTGDGRTALNDKYGY